MTDQIGDGVRGLVKNILVESCGMDARVLATGTGSLIDLGMDSLAVLELQAKALERFDVRLPDDIGEATVDDVVVAVESQVSA